MKKTLQISGLVGVIVAILILGIGVGIYHIDKAAYTGIILFLSSALIKSIGHAMRQ